VSGNVSRSHVVSSFTIIKGALVSETYAVFQNWDFSRSKQENLALMEHDNIIGARSANWLRDVRKVLNRRFDPAERDRPLVELAQHGCQLEIWRSLLLWHITRDEFLVRDFLLEWLYPQYIDGVYRLSPGDVVPYLQALSTRDDIEWAGSWTPATTSRVASGLLHIAADFDLLTGGAIKRFASYHLPEDSFLYLLHAVAQFEPTARGIIDSPEWRLFLMNANEVEAEILRLHQFHRLRYEAAGSLERLDLPASSLGEYALELVP
jgi:hypothetical protein